MPSAPVVQSDPGPQVPEDSEAPEGPVCDAADSCGAGSQCRGAPGCRSEWACGAPRECMSESVAYCDCEGTTFYAPGGCPGRPYEFVGPCDALGERIVNGQELGIPAHDEQPTTQSRLCSDNASCRGGEVCWGVPGCYTDWSCVRARGCRRDRAEYCGCDGASFVASSNCPGRPYVHRGACTGNEGAVAVAPDPELAMMQRSRASGSRALTLSEAPASRAPLGPNGCRSNRDCRGAQVCQGPPGCGFEWTCERPAQRCVRDTQVFCDCEGRDFRASMFCPGRPYRHRGSCEIDRLLELSGASAE